MKSPYGKGGRDDVPDKIEQITVKPAPTDALAAPRPVHSVVVPVAPTGAAAVKKTVLRYEPGGKVELHRIRFRS